MTLNVTIDTIYGECPVQAEGMIDGLPFYFRARHASWRIEIGRLDDETFWVYSEPYGTDSEAGWMPSSVARAFIVKSAALFEGQRK